MPNNAKTTGAWKSIEKMKNHSENGLEWIEIYIAYILLKWSGFEMVVHVISAFKQLRKVIEADG